MICELDIFAVEVNDRKVSCFNESIRSEVKREGMIIKKNNVQMSGKMVYLDYLILTRCVKLINTSAGAAVMVNLPLYKEICVYGAV